MHVPRLPGPPRFFTGPVFADQTARSSPLPPLQELIHRHKDELAASVTREQGKTLADAHGDVFRGLGACPALAWPLVCLGLGCNPGQPFSWPAAG